MKYMLAVMMLMISVVLGAVDMRLGAGMNTGGRLSAQNGLTISSSKLKEAASLSYQVSVEKKQLALGLGVDLQDKRDIKLSSSGLQTTIRNYSCLPIYATASYCFSTTSLFKPMLIAQLGLSLNDLQSVIVDQVWYSEMKVENGLYYGVGMGLEYRKVSFNLLYRVNEMPTHADSYYNGALFDSRGYDTYISQVNMSLGYKWRL